MNSQLIFTFKLRNIFEKEKQTFSDKWHNTKERNFNEVYY